MGFKGMVCRVVTTLGVVGMGLALLQPGGLAAQEDEERCDCPRVEISPGVVSVLGARPRLGVSLNSSLDRDAEREGARVESVVEGGPADEAGIREGDIITSIDGQSLMDPLDDARAERRLDDDESFPVQRLMALARDFEEGEPVEVGLRREGEDMTVTVEPDFIESDWAFRYAQPMDFRHGEWGEHFRDQQRSLGERMRGLADRVRGWSQSWRYEDEDDPVIVWQGPGDRVEVFDYLRGADGLELSDLNPRLGEYFGTDEGVLVVDVREESTLGLIPGDVILAVDGRRVDSPNDVRRILRSYRSGELVTFRVQRDGGEVEVEGERR